MYPVAERVEVDDVTATDNTAQQPQTSIAMDLSIDTIEHFRCVKSNSWDKLHFITSGKSYKLFSCNKNLKLTFLCALCPSNPEVYISVDPSSSSNL